MAKNERQHMQNLARAQQGRGREQPTDTKAATRVERTKEIERRLVTTQASTASMGKFDRKLEGEKKPRGLKRKVRVSMAPSFKPAHA
jgi:regulator of ribosome biosynthesis